jgi:uncharacterized protein
MSETTTSFEDFARARYVSLMTFRRNGAGVATPIWVAPVDGKLYAVTDGTSPKMKRLKASDRIRLAICDARGKLLGEWAEGHACRVDEARLSERATSALAWKYGWQFAVLRFFSSLSGRVKRRAFIEIVV